VAATLLWLATLWFGKMWLGTPPTWHNVAWWCAVRWSGCDGRRSPAICRPLARGGLSGAPVHVYSIVQRCAALPAFIRPRGATGGGRQERNSDPRDLMLP
jgi:hypothetical protein